MKEDEKIIQIIVMPLASPYDQIRFVGLSNYGNTYKAIQGSGWKLLIKNIKDE